MKRSSHMKRSGFLKEKYITHPCVECGTVFTTEQRYLSRGPQQGRYCSKTCSDKAKQKQVNKTCNICDKEFAVPECHAFIKSCSRECADKSRRTKQERTCQTCGKVFFISPSQFKYYKGAGRFCSRECSYAGIVIRTAKKPIPDRYGRSKRKADKEWSKAVKERDQYICQRCGVYNKYNHAHHVATRSQRPDLKYEVSNGKTLCNSCHTYIHHHAIEAQADGWLSTETYELAQQVQKQTD